jgi:hypothetical protein
MDELHKELYPQKMAREHDLLRIIKKLIKQIDEVISSHMNMIDSDSLQQVTQSEELIQSLTELFGIIENL